ATPSPSAHRVCDRSVTIIIIEGWIGSVSTRWKVRTSVGKMRDSWRCSADIAEPHQLDEIK
ncbi:hypothetical protein ACDH50_20355, partial [Xanthomonas fragariae]|uniref:hypothetical protein n=1 Tax=Xanthomonas fragariae TaxID=48664 RepID=UPI003530F27C